MKKMTFKTIAIHTMAMAALALTLGACSENENEMPDTTPKGEKITFTASLPGADTRLSHSDPTTGGVTVKWTEQDQLKLFPIDKSPSLGTFSVVENSVSTDGKNATFEGTAQVGTDYYFLYGPGDKIPDNDDGYNFRFSWLGQKQTANNSLAHLKDYNLIAALVSNGDMTNLTFNHAVAILQFNLTGLPLGTYTNFAIKSSVADGILSAYRMDSSSPEYIQEFPMELDNIALDGTETLTLWMMMPAGSMNKTFKAGNLTLEVTDDNNKTYNNVTAIAIPWNGKEYDAGKRYSFETAMQEVQQQTELDRFLEWATNDGWKNEGFTLAESIDLTGVDFRPIGNGTTQFTQTFDGGGYTINGLTVRNVGNQDIGMFGYIGSGGTVSNVTLKGTVAGTQHVGGIAGRNYGTISGCTFEGSVTGDYAYVAGIVGRNHGLVIGCQTTQSTITGTNNVSGIAGWNHYNTNALVIACLADGITLVGTATSPLPGMPIQSFLGCIVGWNDNSATITACVSTHASMTTPNATLYGGGISAYNHESGIVGTSYWETGSTYSAAIGADYNNQENNCISFAPGSFQSGDITALNEAITSWNDNNTSQCPFYWELDGALPKLVAIQ